MSTGTQDLIVNIACALAFMGLAHLVSNWWGTGNAAAQTPPAETAAPAVVKASGGMLEMAKTTVFYGVLCYISAYLWTGKEPVKEYLLRYTASQAATTSGEATEAEAQEEQSPVDEETHRKVIDGLMERAKQQQGKMKDEKLTMEHMVMALAENPRFAEILSCAEGLSEEQIKAAIRKSRIMYNRGTNSELDEWVESPATALSKYARDLTQLARETKLDPVIGRTDELRRMINVLCRRTKNNPVVLGEPGVGKTALVEGLAQRVAAGDVPPALKDCAVMALDMGLLMAGALMPGEFEERLKTFLKELGELGPGRCILFIDDIHTVTGPNAQQGGGVMDASVLLKPLLGRGELRCIGATTTDKYRRFIEKDPALERRFQQVLISAPDVAQSTAILRGLRLRFEKHHGVHISDAALEAAVQLSDRYLPDRFLPDKAIDLIDEAAAQVGLEMALKPEALDRLEREIHDLELQRRMLRRTAAFSKHDALALEGLEASLAAAKQRRDEALALHAEEHGAVPEVVGLQDDIDKLNDEIEAAEDAGDTELADKLRREKREELLSRLRAAQDSARKKRGGKAASSNYNLLGMVGGRREVNESDVSAIISNWTGIPLTRLVESELGKLLHLAEELHKRIIGQEEAVAAVAEAIQRSRAGMKDPNGPIASFLFLGPTGVGKTELAKALASHLFSSEDAMVRLDMSEYMEKHAVSKLIGAPPGYVGFDEGGQLTEAVRRKPYTVVLFDEVEKAHVDVFNLLLQILDDGRVTDSQGRTVSFKNAIIIMTSNLGSKEIYKATAGQPEGLQGLAQNEQIRELVMEQVRRHFQPEFVNRVDEFIIFEPLRSHQIKHIVKLKTQGVVGRLAEKRMRLVLRRGALAYLSRKGFDPIFGARPIKRAIQRDLETPLAQALLKAEFQEEDVIVVDCPDQEHLAFKRLPGPCPPELIKEAEEEDGGEEEEGGPGGSAGEASTSTAGAGPSPSTAKPQGKAKQPSNATTTTSSSSSSPAPKAGKPGASAGSAPASAEGVVVETQPPRAMKFDPLKRMSKMHAQGVDLSKDGSAANSDPSSLPTETN